MFCVQCGSKLPDDAKFCLNCGAKVTAPAAPAEPATPVVESMPVAEPVAESVSSAAPVVEPVVVEPAPEVAPVAVEPAPEVIPAAVDPAPAVEATEVEPAQEIAAKEIPVAEPVTEAVVEAAPAVEAVPVEPAPAVESVPVTEAVTVQEAPVVEAASVEPAPAVEEAVVEPAPAVEPVTVEPAATSFTPEGAPVETTVAPEGTPVETTAAPGSTNASATPAGQPKKKKKVWLIILIIVLAVFLLGAILLIGGCAIAVGIIKKNVAKNGQNIINQIGSELTSELTANGFTETPSGYSYGNPDIEIDIPGLSDAGEELDYDVSISNLKNAIYDGTCEIASVSGADEMINYLEKVSGKTLSDAEKENLRNPSLGSSNQFQLLIYSADEDYSGEKYFDGEFGILLPVTIGSDVPLTRSFSGWDMLTYDEIAAKNYENKITIRPVNNKFSLKSQVPDEDHLYANNMFPAYAAKMGDGDFGTELTGTVKHGNTDVTFGIDGTYTLMFWYGDMAEPYIVKYNYTTKYLKNITSAISESGYNNGNDVPGYDDMDWENYDWENYDWDNFDPNDMFN